MACYCTSGILFDMFDCSRLESSTISGSTVTAVRGTTAHKKCVIFFLSRDDDFTCVLLDFLQPSGASFVAQRTAFGSVFLSL